MPTPSQIAAAAVAELKAAKTLPDWPKDPAATWARVHAIIERCAANNPGPAEAAGKAKVDGADFGDRKKVPPTPEQVTAYSAAIGYPMDGQAWCDSYEVKGWKVGDHRMKDWQAAVRNWKANRYGQDGIALKDGAAAAGRDYSKL